MTKTGTCPHAAGGTDGKAADFIESWIPTRQRRGNTSIQRLMQGIISLFPNPYGTNFLTYTILLCSSMGYPTAKYSCGLVLRSARSPSRRATLYIRAHHSSFVPSTAAPIAAGWSESHLLGTSAFYGAREKLGRSDKGQSLVPDEPPLLRERMSSGT
jgi:hypothetical protein